MCLCRKIQSVFELSDGSGLAVTVARYETPAHTNIDKVGHLLYPHPLPIDLFFFLFLFSFQVGGMKYLIAC